MAHRALIRLCMGARAIPIVIGILSGWGMPAQAGPIHDAARRGDLQAIQKALDGGAKADERDSQGVTPLMEASWHGKLDAVRLLIARKADVNARSAKGGSALMEASIKGYEAVVRALITAGADVKASNNNRVTALMWAAAKGYPAVVRHLIAAGADVRARSRRYNDPDTLLPVEEKSALVYALEQRQEETARLLIEAGSEVEIDCAAVKCAPDSGDWIRSPLVYASAGAMPAIVKLMVMKGAKIKGGCDKECVSSETPLIAAALSGSVETVDALLSLGADVNEEGSSEGLSDGGAQFSGATGTALMHLLYRAAIGGPSLSDPVKGGFAGVAKRLIDAGARTDFVMTCSGLEVSPYAYSSLGLAVKAGRAEIVKALLEKGAAVNPPVRSERGGGDGAIVDVPPLFLAVEGGDAAMVSLLLEKGADPNAYANLYGTSNLDYAQVVDRHTALHRAARTGNGAVVSLLLKSGAGVDLRSDGGATALMASLGPVPYYEKDREKWLLARAGVVRMLLAAGADPSARDKKGNTALSLAKKNGHAAAAEALVRAGARE